MLHCVDTALAALLSPDEATTDNVNILICINSPLELNYVLLWSCPVSVSCFSFSSFFCLFCGHRDVDCWCFCEQHICLFVWPQGLGLLVLREQHICLPHPCFSARPITILRQSAQVSGLVVVWLEWPALPFPGWACHPKCNDVADDQKLPELSTRIFSPQSHKELQHGG